MAGMIVPALTLGVTMWAAMGAAASAEPGAAAGAPRLQLTVVYDHTTTRADMRGDWGFSTLVEFHGQRVLFDGGSRPEILAENLHALGMERSSIQKTIVSHQLPDHTNAIYRVLPAGFVDFLDTLGQDPKRMAAPAQLAPGIYTTGELPGPPPEQALVIETAKGIVMLVSCAHPGIARMVETVEKRGNVRSIRLIVGGLHMYEQKERQIRPVVAQLQKLNVESLMLGHCTGDLAMKIFREAYGERCGTLGAGKRIVLE